jgi:hypothetical protein
MFMLAVPRAGGQGAADAAGRALALHWQPAEQEGQRPGQTGVQRSTACVRRMMYTCQSHSWYVNELVLA